MYLDFFSFLLSVTSLGVDRADLRVIFCVILLFVVGTVLVQSEWLNSTLSPVVYGDIVLSIKINTQIHKITSQIKLHTTIGTTIKQVSMKATIA